MNERPGGTDQPEQQPTAPADAQSGPPPQQAGPTPYGQVPSYPPAPRAPYGVPPGGEATNSQAPYGHTPYHQSPYGSPAYGMPGYGAPLRDPDARPGTVLAAAIVTFITAGLSALLFAIFTLVLLVARGSFLEGFREGAGMDPSADDAGTLFGVLVIIGIVLVLWCVAAIVLAALALKRRNGARIGLVVSASLSIVVSLLGITSGISVVTLIAAIAVIVCLFTGGANEWYRRAKGEPEIVGMQRF